MPLVFPRGCFLILIASLPGKSAKRVFALDDPAIHLMKRMDARVRPAHDHRVRCVVLTLRWRARPRPLRAPQALERLGHSEHAEIVEAAADDLDADRETV